ncbi:MAG: MFS transporter [Novosphingobium sp.]|nr:MFS transporter [Novosphingobium sp.]
MQKPWRTILFLWLVGVLAAAQLAKFSTIAPLLRARFALSLPETGLLISLLEVGGATLGFVAGLTLGWISFRRSLIGGMAILAAMSLLEAVTTDPTTLFAARAAEGIGYLLVVIAAPTAIAAVADDRSRPRALALWSTFVPVGIAIGSAVTGSGAASLGLDGILFLWAILLALAIAPASRLHLGHGGTRRIVMPAPAAWISTFAFGIYTLFLCALTMLLPSFLTETHGATLGEAGLVASLASLSALPASGLAVLMIRNGSLDARRLLLIAVPALAVTALLVPPAFAASTGLAATSAAVVAAVLVSGLVPPLMFARLPVLAGATSPHDPRIATANGLLTQFGAGGALLGPPLGGLIVERWGWTALGGAVAALALLMLGLLGLSEVAAKRWLPK